MKKLVSLLLILCLLVPIAAGAEVAKEGFPVTDEKITLTVFTGTETLTPTDINTMTIFKKAEEATNIHIEWITVPQGSAYNDKKSLMLATDDLPDIFFGQISATELAKYGAEGSFIPMEELIAEYAPNLNAIIEKRPELIPFVTAPDGHIYGVPKITEGLWNQVRRVYNINTQWLKNLGLDMPTNLTQFKEMLIAFRDKDPNQNGINDEIPITFECGSSFNVGVFEYVFAAYGMGLGDPPYLDVADGKVVSFVQDPRYADAIRYIADLYAENLIDPDAFVMDSAQWKAKVNADPVVVGVSPNWDYNDNISDPVVLAQYSMMPPLYSDDGAAPVIYSPAMYGYNRGSGVITKACKNPEAAMRWIDYWFDEINSFETSEGPIGERLFYDETGSTLLLGAGDAVGSILPRASVCINPFAVRALMKEYFVEKHIAYPSTFPKVDFITEYVLPFADPDPFNTKLYYTLEESERLTMLETDIKNFINRKAAEWIINGTIDGEWDAFQSDLLKMGLEDYLTIQQTAYDHMY